ncbi:hypothetical protein [Streptomyces microflavus]|uniref:hypothetical protein n=1 Tax=Streptomyces microflavus TaxID=1919 RepID=UPI0033AAB2D6
MTSWRPRIVRATSRRRRAGVSVCWPDRRSTQLRQARCCGRFSTRFPHRRRDDETGWRRRIRGIGIKQPWGAAMLTRAEWR